MVERADARGQEQPFRRVQRHRGVQDHRARHHQRVGVALLHLAHGVGAAGERIVLPRRQRGGDVDGAQRGWFAVRALGAAVGRDAGGESVELRGVGHVVAQAQRDHLRRVGDRAAADRHQQVGVLRPRLVGGGDHVGARGMRADAGAEPGHAVAERGADLVHRVGLPRERAAGQHIHRLCADVLHLLRQRGGEGFAVDNSLHLGEAPGAFGHAEASRCRAALCLELGRGAGACPHRWDVDVRKPECPAGQGPVHWRLLTMHRVETDVQARPAEYAPLPPAPPNGPLPQGAHKGSRSSPPCADAYGAKPGQARP